jgi:uncharacterized protein
MIIDAHAHVSRTDYGNADLLIRRLDEAGIERGIAFPGGTMDIRVMTLYVIGDKSPSKAIPNDVMIETITKYPNRLWGFVGVDPLQEEEAIAHFELGVRHGCVGIKLNPLVHRFSFAGEVLDHIAVEAGKRGMPLYTHTLYDPGASSKKLALLARRHPATNFVIGHLGFGPADVHAMEAARDLPNLYLEVSLATFLALTEAIRIAGAHKLVFGSEFPMSTPKIELMKIRELPSSLHQAILHDNVRRAIPAIA